MDEFSHLALADALEATQKQAAEAHFVDLLPHLFHEICTSAFPAPCVALNTLEYFRIDFAIRKKRAQN